MDVPLGAGPRGVPPVGAGVLPDGGVGVGEPPASTMLRTGVLVAAGETTDTGSPAPERPSTEARQVGYSPQTVRRETTTRAAIVPRASAGIAQAGRGRARRRS